MVSGLAFGEPRNGGGMGIAMCVEVMGDAVDVIRPGFRIDVLALSAGVDYFR